ncbi:MAG: carboxypeptidase-like regulatory domain-containing protein, partial [Vicinamibacterales bacterium]
MSKLRGSLTRLHSALPHLAAAVVALMVGVLPASGQGRSPGVPTESGGVIQGRVTTVDGSVPLPGVIISLSSERSNEVITAYTEGDGSFVFEGLSAGAYVVVATLDGFERRTATVDVLWNQTARVALDLRVAASEEVEVTASGSAEPAPDTLIRGETLTGRELEQIAPGGGLQAALRLFVSVIEVPGGVSIKGGLPSQSTVQLGPGMFVDPATGLSQARLPDDA